MLKLIARLLLGSAARAGKQVLDAEARLAVPPRALADADEACSPEKEIPVRPSGSTMATGSSTPTDQRGPSPTVH